MEYYEQNNVIPKVGIYIDYRIMKICPISNLLILIKIILMCYLIKL